MKTVLLPAFIKPDLLPSSFPFFQMTLSSTVNGIYRKFIVS